MFLLRWVIQTSGGGRLGESSRPPFFILNIRLEKTCLKVCFTLLYLIWLLINLPKGNLYKMQSLKIILPIALCAFFITGIVTNNIRKEAEKHLKNEEKITAAGNQQILSQQEGLRNSEKQRGRAQEEREFKHFLGVKSFEEFK